MRYFSIIFIHNGMVGFGILETWLTWDFWSLSLKMHLVLQLTQPLKIFKMAFSSLLLEERRNPLLPDPKAAAEVWLSYM